METYTGRKDDFVMFLPDDLPLVSYDTVFEIAHDDSRTEIRISTTLDQGSAEDLEDDGLFEEIRLPERTGRYHLGLRLNLVAKEPVCRAFREAHRTGEDPIELITRREGDDVPPFRYLANYHLDTWEEYTRSL